MTKEAEVSDNSTPNLARRAAAEFFAMAMFMWVGTGELCRESSSNNHTYISE